MTNLNQECPCGSAASYQNCCYRYISGAQVAPTAEALMRSRYSAYTQNEESYLRSSWDPRTCPNERIVHDEPTKWLGLEVRHHSQQGDSALVEFIARYKIGGRAHRLHEISNFLREDGRWFYVNGTFPQND